MGDYPAVYSFDEISASELRFEEFSRSTEVLFFLFLLYLRLFDGARFQYPQVWSIYIVW